MSTKIITTSTPQDDTYILENYLTVPLKRIAKHIGRSDTLVRTRMRQLGLVIPPEVRQKFKEDSMKRKGCIPLNKGKKQDEYMSVEAIERTKATRFRKGHVPHNTKQEDGIITIHHDHKNRRGSRLYKWIRLGLGKWQMLHVYNWIKKNGPVPEGYIVVFKTTDTMNCELDNLELITRAENMRRNSLHRYPIEVKTAIRKISKLNKKIRYAEEQI